MLNIGPQELLLVLVIALIVVGPTRLPELGRSIGKGLRELRKAQDEVKRTIQVNLDEPAVPKATSKKTPPPAEGETGGPSEPSDGGPAGALAVGAASAAGPDPVPLAAEPPQASEVLEISRTLGRSLAELRRAREEVQRGFSVDLTDVRQSRPAAGAAPDPAPDAEPGTTAADEAPLADASPVDDAPAG